MAAIRWTGLGVAARSMALTAVTVVALVAVSTPTAGARARATGTQAAASPSRRVEVAGDSLSVQTESYQVADLAAAGFAAQVDAKYSQPIESSWIRDRLADAAGRGDDIAVVETSSNDALEAWNRQLSVGWAAAEAAYRSLLEQTVDELIDQCVVIVDSRDAAQAAWYHLPEAAPHINAIIASVAAERPNVVVVPWSDISRQHDEWFWQDGLHFGDPNNGAADFHPVGAEAFSSALTAGAVQCATKLDATHPARFTARATPVRVLDTRDGTGGHLGRLAPGQVLDLQLGGVAGVPANVESVDLNVTAVNETGPGFLVAFPAGAFPPPSSNLNFSAAEVVADHVVTRVGFGGRVSIRSMTTTDVVVDLSGWYTPDGVDGLATVTPARVLDTRIGLGAPEAPVTGATSIDVKVTGVGGVPLSGVDAVVLNLTATNVERLTVVRAWPSDQPPPLVSNLNPAAGATRANLVTVRVAADGTVRLDNLLGRIDLVADVQGWYGAAPATGLRGIAPRRALDTRRSDAAVPEPLGPGEAVTLHLAGVKPVPPTAVGVFVTVTAVVPSADGYLTLYPSDHLEPVVSDVNFARGDIVPNLALVPVGPTGDIVIRNSLGSTDVVVDVVGWVG